MLLNRHFILITFLLWFHALGFSQAAESRFTDFPDIRKGVLLVCLQNNQRYIKTLEDRGFKQKAAEVRHQTDTTNRKIVKAALTNFKFCRVLFFYLPDTSQLRLKQKSGFFLDENLKINESLTLDTDNYLIAEIFEHPPFTHNGNQTTTGSVEMLGLRRPDFSLLSDPFPWYIKVNRNFSMLRKSYDEIFLELDAELREWYYQPSKRTIRQLEKRNKIKDGVN